VFHTICGSLQAGPRVSKRCLLRETNHWTHPSLLFDLLSPL